jgi:hypothetical protein
MKQKAIHPLGQSIELRQRTDRRVQRSKSLRHVMHKGRRENARRQTEVKQGYYTDRYEKWVGLCIVAITLMSMLDAFLTLNILDKGGIEVNPVMSALLAINTQAFLIGKFFVTVVCLLFALVHINFHVLRILPMKYILVSITIFYVFLIAYELLLLAII